MSHPTGMAASVEKPATRRSNRSRSSSITAIADEQGCVILRKMRMQSALLAENGKAIHLPISMLRLPLLHRNSYGIRRHHRNQPRY